MTIIPINFADFDSVFIHNGTPHCKKQGAMNKLNALEDGGGYWRCITVSGYIMKDGNKQHVETPCRSGCCEIRTELSL